MTLKKISSPFRWLMLAYRTLERPVLYRRIPVYLRRWLSLGVKGYVAVTLWIWHDIQTPVVQVIAALDRGSLLRANFGDMFNLIGAGCAVTSLALLAASGRQVEAGLTASLRF